MEVFSEVEVAQQPQEAVDFSEEVEQQLEAPDSLAQEQPVEEPVQVSSVALEQQILPEEGFLEEDQQEDQKELYLEVHQILQEEPDYLAQEQPVEEPVQVSSVALEQQILPEEGFLEEDQQEDQEELYLEVHQFLQEEPDYLVAQEVVVQVASASQALIQQREDYLEDHNQQVQACLEDLLEEVLEEVYLVQEEQPWPQVKLWEEEQQVEDCLEAVHLE